MRRVRFPLFSKILFWVFMNLVLLGGILLFIFNLDFRFTPRSPFFSESANRIEAVSRLISMELSESTREEQDAVLEKYAAAYNVEFFVFDSSGREIAGKEKQMPAEVMSEINRLLAGLPPLESPALRRKTNSGDIKNQTPSPPPAGRPLFFLKTANPTLYWAVSPVLIFSANQSQPQRAVLLTASTSMSGNGLFFDPKPWLIIIGVITLFSILFWLPIVRGITKAVKQVTEAAEQITEEDFDVRVDEKRTDELRRLGTSINRLANRLSGFVHGQKRFLGDISHELNTPLARLQLTLSIIEDETNEKTRPYLEKAREEVKLMSKLVGELLTYSKAGIKAKEVRLERAKLRSLVESAVKQEKSKDDAEVEINIDDRLQVSANVEMLSRAIGNVIRNAIKYAGNDGLISITAEEKDSRVSLSIADNGAGVSVAEIEKLFDPFYRTEPHRSRETGGSGLGLAIVKTCVEACQGKVFARNRQPHGLEVIIVLKPVAAEKIVEA